MASVFPKLALAILLSTFTACAPQVGDSCETSAECPSTAICDVTAPDGYCTIEGCDAESCPNGTVCVEFNTEDVFCMDYCETDSQCRSGYVCRDDVGAASFCYVAP